METSSTPPVSLPGSGARAAGTPGAVPRGFVLCADDYGLSMEICRTIERLIAAGRLSATSCMVALPAFAARAKVLHDTVTASPADIGLHLTLTDHPALAADAAALLDGGGRLPRLGRLLAAALTHRLPRPAVAAEISAQLDAFEAVWGQPPDFVDGHQHVHVLPGVREALIAEMVRRYGRRVYLRSVVEPPAACVRRGVATGKALFLSGLGLGARRLAAAAGLTQNDSFRGLHDFSGRTPFRTLFQRFLSGANGLRPMVHVHPGVVDDELIARDPLTTPRVWEAEYLASDAFVDDCRAADMRPVRLSALLPSGM